MSDAFTRLAEWIAQFWDHMRPWAIVDQFEGGVIFRLGKYARTIEPGWNWKWPLAEIDKTVHTVVTTMSLPPQTVTTNDGKAVVVSCIVKYQIRDVKPYFCQIWDAGDVLRDVTMGSVKQVVMSRNYDALMHDDIEKLILDTVRREVNEYGFKIHRVTCVDLAQVRSVRLIGMEEMRFHTYVHKV